MSHLLLLGCWEQAVDRLTVLVEAGQVVTWQPAGADPLPGCDLVIVRLDGREPIPRLPSATPWIAWNVHDGPALALASRGKWPAGALDHQPGNPHAYDSSMVLLDLVYEPLAYEALRQMIDWLSLGAEPPTGCVRNLGQPHKDLREVAGQLLRLGDLFRPPPGGLCGRTEILPQILDTPTANGVICQSQRPSYTIEPTEYLS